MARTIFRGSITLIILTLVVSVAMGQDGEKKKRRQRKDPAVLLANRKIKQFEKKIQLTDEQKTKINEIAKASQQEVKAATDAVTAVLTPEQVELRKTLSKKATEAKMKWGERQAMILAKLELSDEQKTKYEEANKKARAVQKQFQGKLVELLTDEQKAAIAPKKRNRKKGKKAAAADA